jgi:integrase
MFDNMPVGNEWYLQDTDDKSVNFGKRFAFKFDQFKAGDIRNLIKSYVWQNYQSGSVTLRTISATHTGFKKFNLFASQNGIESLVDFDANDADNFKSFLKLFVSDRTQKPLRYLTQIGLFTALRTVVYWGQIFTPELVPATEVFVGSEYPRSNIGHKIEYIPDDVVKQINAALLIEENPYVKYGITILFSTGMRVSELLNLEVNCITPHLLNGYTLADMISKNAVSSRIFR